MNSVYENLFDTYATECLRQAGAPDTAPLVALLDSMALKNVERHFSQESADLVEVLPGLMPKIIRQLCRTTGRPIIAGGLITDKEDVTGALGAGAVAVSSTNPAVWSM